MAKRTIFCGILTMLALLFLAQCSRNNLEMVEVTRPGLPAQTLALPTSAEPPAPASAMPTADTAAAPTPAPVSNAPAEPPSDVIRRAMLAQLQAPRERITNKLVSADGSVTTSVMEFIAPANFHIRTDEMELIAVEGKGAWMKSADGWQAAPPEMAQAFASARDPEKIQALLEQIVWGDAQFVGVESLHGKTMWVYTYTTIFKGLKQNGGDIHGANQLWVGAADGLPYKLVSESDSLFSDTGQDRAEQWHDYDAAFTIEPPM
jgi:hypothetical protein